MDELKRPAAGDTAAGSEHQQGQAEGSATSHQAQGTKWQRVLAAFLMRGLHGWNRFEAARELRDHVLPTTVSQLEKRGVRISRREETIEGHYGPITCARYWLAPEGCQRARDLLGYQTASAAPGVSDHASRQAGEARAPAS